MIQDNERYNKFFENVENSELRKMLAAVMVAQERYLAENSRPEDLQTKKSFASFPKGIARDAIHEFSMSSSPKDPLPPIAEFYIAKDSEKEILVGVCYCAEDTWTSRDITFLPTCLTCRVGDSMESIRHFYLKDIIRKATTDDLLLLNELAKETDRIYYIEPIYGGVPDEKSFIIDNIRSITI